MSSKVVIAAGFIVFRNAGSQIQYLLLQASDGVNHWTPPKGIPIRLINDMINTSGAQQVGLVGNSHCPVVSWWY